ncbi:MAG: hypothetical protein IJ144_06975 [Prevotella sp.]|nr:hypothetical protein [Prevotella sp.]
MFQTARRRTSWVLMREAAANGVEIFSKVSGTSANSVEGAHLLLFGRKVH